MAKTEVEAVDVLLNKELYREAVVHLYFSFFYISQSLICNQLTKKPSHRNVEAIIHQTYGRNKSFPRRYIDLHSKLHNLRNEIDYNTTHAPEPSKLKKYYNILKYYFIFAQKSIKEIEYEDILSDVVFDNGSKIKDFSIDIYCPKTYSHHTRFTIWFPPFYLKVFNIDKLYKNTKETLKKLHVKNTNNYVAGFNSKLDQYTDKHLLLFDIDSFDAEVEATLKKIGGTLLKTERGFHFISHRIIEGKREWEKALRKILRDKVLKSRVDRNHIKISLQRGYSTLRITTCPIKTVRPMYFKEI